MKPFQNSHPLMNSTLPLINTVPNSELLAKVNLASSQVVAKVHPDYALELDPIIRDALQEVNRLRRNKQDKLGDPLKEHYPFTRYRVICPPKISNSTMELHLAPIDFAYIALLKDPVAPDSVKTYISKKVDQMAAYISTNLNSNHPILNGYNRVPLGIEIVIITRDGKTLLRRRGMSVLIEGGDWDVAFSGYIGIESLVGDRIDIGIAIDHESKREIGVFPASINDMIITGLHRNTSNEAIDILGYWKIAATVEQLAELLSESFPGVMKTFQTTKRAEEPFVWDTSNLIIDFDSTVICKTLEQVRVRIHDLTPEALASLLLALDSAHRS